MIGQLEISACDIIIRKLAYFVYISPEKNFWGFFIFLCKTLAAELMLGKQDRPPQMRGLLFCPGELLACPNYAYFTRNFWPG
ncbi:hypothetical protein CIW84_16830 [Heyndrickxia coagulans]|nr:hypothetical protein CIW84_16830 [Heyndrickxia coagulans]